MICVRESALDGSPSMQVMLVQAPSMGCSGFPKRSSPVLRVSRLGHPFTGAFSGLVSGAALRREFPIDGCAVSGATSAERRQDTPAPLTDSQRRQGASAISPIRAEPEKRIRSITPKGTAQLRQIAAGLVEGARPGDERIKPRIRLPRYAVLIPLPSFLLRGK